MTRNADIKKAAKSDWPWKKVLFELDAKNWSLRQLGIRHGYTNGSALQSAKNSPYPKAEQIIASAIGVEPQEIWPSRYDRYGQPNRKGNTPKRGMLHATTPQDMKQAA